MAHARAFMIFWKLHVPRPPSNGETMKNNDSSFHTLLRQADILRHCMLWSATMNFLTLKSNLYSVVVRSNDTKPSYNETRRFPSQSDLITRQILDPLFAFPQAFPTLFASTSLRGTSRGRAATPTTARTRGNIFQREIFHVESVTRGRIRCLSMSRRHPYRPNRFYSLIINYKRI